MARAVALPALSGQSVLTVGIAAALGAVAFVAQGGQILERTTHTEIALILGGAALTAAAILRRGFVNLYGGWALAGLTALTVWTTVSIAWSVAPSDSWEEANRTLAYLAVFAAGLALVRLVPAAWASVIGGVALAAVVVCGYALATKVFPGSLAPNELFARLREPFGYWNSVGAVAACGVPPLLWLAARREGHGALNALAWPGLGVLLVCLMLSYSRGALLALVLGLAVWFAVVPLRLRAATALAGATIGAAGPVAWAFTQSDLTTDRLPLAVRSDAGTELGALLAIMIVALSLAGLAAGYLSARRPPGPRTRALAGRGFLAVVATVVGAFAIAVATAPGGLSKQWSDLTDPNARTPANTPDRLVAASSVRARYWREAFKVHADNPLIGAGAGGYATARTRFRTGTLEVRHAHGYAVQTLADLGWIGLALSLAALAAWLAAALRAIGLRRADSGRPWTAERIGLVTLGVVVFVFGVHSFVDWTWFVPANAVMALAGAGWLAGRGPLDATPGGAAVRLRAEPVRPVVAYAVIATAALAAWAALQPVRSVHAGDAALDRVEKGQLFAAADIARIATERNPLAVAPLWELSVIEDLRGRGPAAEAALERAVRLQPANAETWQRLGRYRLTNLNQPKPALDAFRAAYYLDPQSPEAISDFLEAQRRVEAGS